MNIRPWLPTKSDQKAARTFLKDVARGLLILVVLISVVAVIAKYPIILVWFLGVIASFVVMVILWMALAPAQKEDDNKQEISNE